MALALETTHELCVRIRGRLKTESPTYRHHLRLRHGLAFAWLMADEAGDRLYAGCREDLLKLIDEINAGTMPV